MTQAIRSWAEARDLRSRIDELAGAGSCCITCEGADEIALRSLPFLGDESGLTKARDALLAEFRSQVADLSL